MAHGGHRKILQAGARVNDFTLPLLDGGASSLREITVKGAAVLAFFKVTCPVCQFTFPYLERIHKAGRLPVYGISQNCAEDTRDFNREFGITFPTLLDSEESGFAVSNTFGISSVPTLFLVEPDGTIAQVSEGWHKGDIAQLGARAGVHPFRDGERLPDAKAG